MTSDTKNAVVAFVLCSAVLFGFNYFVGPKTPVEQPSGQAETLAPLPSAAPVDRGVALAQDQRVTFHNDWVSGSINLAGAKVDDLSLTKYKQTTEPKSPPVTLLNPQTTADAYFAQLLWKNSSEMAVTPCECPTSQTVWSLAGDSPACLTPTSPVTLVWSNTKGVVFERKITLDAHYMLTFTDKISNMSGGDVQLASSCELWRAKTPQTGQVSSVHEGGIAYLDDKLQDITFRKLNNKKTILKDFREGWAGFTDKYWFASFVGGTNSTAVIRSFPDKFLCQVNEAPCLIKAGQTLEVSHRLFAGAKSLDVLDAYAAKGIKKLDLAVDFGWLYFLTKPLYYLLRFLGNFLGNWALAIVVMTLLSKAVTYPMASSSYRSMAKMKALQPKMEQLKKRYGDDKTKLNMELMKLYKKEQFNPMSSIVPMFIQIPIFYCLYKVFAIGLEMRHAPLALWIHDLSAPDPTSLFNLFGLIPWTPPSFLQIGLLPLIMGGTMLLQQVLAPQTGDASQRKMMFFMPLIFLFMFASFPSGLVLYWTLNNILSIIQQFVMERTNRPAKRVGS